MATVIDNYIKFFLHQKQEIIKEYNKIKDVSLKQLFRESKIIIGRIDRVNSTNGHVIIEIDRHLSVRLKTMMNCTLLSKNALRYLEIITQIGAFHLVNLTNLNTLFGTKDCQI